MSKQQNLKSKFRSSSVWKKWRKVVYDKDKGIDFITQKKVRKGAVTHHMDLREDHYKDLSDPDRFRTLNVNTHKFIHWLYGYWLKDKDILMRIEEVLTYMEIYSND